ncbi:MAG: hypothetical protein K9W42_11635 [Candidatus Heimdallarchaeota archaeon]|nr:hypothetical protein [Candidatus Heimdallarchaeota archaeon]
MIDVYELQIKPRALDMTYTGHVKFTAIVNYLQEVAFEHASNLGVSFQHIFKRNLTWYLLRYYIEMYEYPTIDELLTIRSWVARSESKKFSLRDFEIINESGKILCSATTSWVLYNYVKRKPVNYLEYVSDRPILDKRAVSYDFPKLPLPEKTDASATLTVRRSDLDLNNHVNNAVYVEWLLESVPAKILKKYVINKLEISFKGQAFHQDSVLVETELQKASKTEGSLVTLSKITKIKNNELLTKARLYWKAI